MGREQPTIVARNTQRVLEACGIEVIGRTQPSGSKEHQKAGKGKYNTHADYTAAATLKVATGIMARGGTVTSVHFNKRVYTKVVDGKRRHVYPDSRVEYVDEGGQPRTEVIEIASDKDVVKSHRFTNNVEKYDVGPNGEDVINDFTGGITYVFPSNLEESANKKLETNPSVLPSDPNSETSTQVMVLENPSQLYVDDFCKEAENNGYNPGPPEVLGEYQRPSTDVETWRKPGGGGDGGSGGGDDGGGGGGRGGGGEGGNNSNQEGGEQPQDDPANQEAQTAIEQEGLNGSAEQEGREATSPYAEATDGDIGGVGLRAALCEETWSHISQPGTEAGSKVTFVIRDCVADDQAVRVPAGLRIPALSTDIVRQLYYEVYQGVYVAGKLPFVSLHFNNRSNLYPVMFPEYRGTAVGHIMVAADYYMKGMCHGGYYLLLGGEEIDATNLHDLFEEIDGFESLHEIMGSLGLSGNDEEQVSTFHSAFRIIMDGPPKVNSLGVTVESEYKIERDVGATAQYMAMLEAHRQANAGVDTENYTRLLEAFERKRNSIENTMHTHPYFARLFQYLSLIQSFASLMINLKAVGLEPIIPDSCRRARVPALTGFPRELPHLPIRKIVQVEEEFTWRELAPFIAREPDNELARFFTECISYTIHMQCDVLQEQLNVGLERAREQEAQLAGEYQQMQARLEEATAQAEVERSRGQREVDRQIQMQRDRIRAAQRDIPYGYQVDQNALHRANNEVARMQREGNEHVNAWYRERRNELQQAFAEARQAYERSRQDIRAHADSLRQLQLGLNRLGRDARAEPTRLDGQAAATQLAAGVRTALERRQRNHKHFILDDESLWAPNRERIQQFSGQAIERVQTELLPQVSAALVAYVEACTAEGGRNNEARERRAASRALQGFRAQAVLLHPQAADIINLVLNLKARILRRHEAPTGEQDEVGTHARIVGGCGFRMNQGPRAEEDTGFSASTQTAVRNLEAEPYTVKRANGHALSIFTIQVARQQSLNLANGREQVYRSCGLSDIHLYAAANDTAALSQALRHGNLNEQSHNGTTPLCLASIMGSINAVELLLRRGADLSICTFGDLTPLMAAIMKGHNDIALMLIRSEGAGSMHAQLSDGRNALHIAATTNAEAVVDVLIALADPDYLRSKHKVTGEMAIHLASARGYAGIVHSFVQALPELAALALPNGETPLHLACRGGHMEVAQLLLRLTVVDPLVKTVRRKNTIQTAIQAGFLELALACLHGRTVRAEEQRELMLEAMRCGGSAPRNWRFFQTVCNSCPEALHPGRTVVDPNSGWTPLHFLAAHDNISFVCGKTSEELRALGGSIRDKNGRLATEIALNAGNLAFVKALNRVMSTVIEQHGGVGQRATRALVGRLLARETTQETGNMGDETTENGTELLARNFQHAACTNCVADMKVYGESLVKHLGLRMLSGDSNASQDAALSEGSSFEDLLIQTAKTASKRGFTKAVLEIVRLVHSIGDMRAVRIGERVAAVSAVEAASKNFLFLLHALVGRGFETIVKGSEEVALAAARHDAPSVLAWILRHSTFEPGTLERLMLTLLRNMPSESMFALAIPYIRRVVSQDNGSVSLLEASAHSGLEVFQRVHRMFGTQLRSFPARCLETAVGRGDAELCSFLVQSIEINPPRVTMLLRETQDFVCFSRIKDAYQPRQLASINEPWARDQETAVAERARQLLQARNYGALNRLMRTRDARMNLMIATVRLRNGAPRLPFAFWLVLDHGARQENRMVRAVQLYLEDTPPDQVMCCRAEGFDEVLSLLEFDLVSHGTHALWALENPTTQEQYKAWAISHRSRYLRKTVFHMAAQGGNPEIVSRVSRVFGVEDTKRLINVVDSRGATAISTAFALLREDTSSSDKATVVRELLQCGADPFVGRPCAFEIAVAIGPLGVGHLVSEDSLKQEALQTPLQDGKNALTKAACSPEMSSALLAAGASPMCPDAHGLLPLHYAIIAGDVRSVSTFLLYGNAEEQLFEPILAGGFVDDSEAIGDAEGDIEAAISTRKEYHGNCAFHLALRFRKTEILRTLVKKALLHFPTAEQAIAYAKFRAEVNGFEWRSFALQARWLDAPVDLGILISAGFEDPAQDSRKGLAAAATSGSMAMVRETKQQLQIREQLDDADDPLVGALQSADPRVIDHILDSMPGAVQWPVPSAHGENVLTFLALCDAAAPAFKVALTHGAKPGSQNRGGEIAAEIVARRAGGKPETLRLLLDESEAAQVDLTKLLRLAISSGDWMKVCILFERNATLLGDMEQIRKEVEKAGDLMQHTVGCFAERRALANFEASEGSLLDLYSRVSSSLPIERAFVLAPEVLKRRFVLTQDARSVEAGLAGALQLALSAFTSQMMLNTVLDSCAVLNVNALNTLHRGSRILHMVAGKQGFTEQLRRMLVMGADPSARDAEGCVPLAIARRSSGLRLNEEEIIRFVSSQRPRSPFPRVAIAESLRHGIELADKEVASLISKPGTQKPTARDKQELTNAAVALGTAALNVLKAWSWLESSTLLDFCLQHGASSKVFLWVVNLIGKNRLVQPSAEGLMPFCVALLNGHEGMFGDSPLSKERLDVLIPPGQRVLALRRAGEGRPELLHRLLGINVTPSSKQLTNDRLRSLSTQSLCLLAKHKHLHEVLRQFALTSRDFAILQALYPQVVSLADIVRVSVNKNESYVQAYQRARALAKHEGRTRSDPDDPSSVVGWIVTLASTGKVSNGQLIRCAKGSPRLAPLLWHLVGDLQQCVSLLSVQGIGLWKPEVVPVWWWAPNHGVPLTKRSLVLRKILSQDVSKARKLAPWSKILSNDSPWRQALCLLDQLSNQQAAALKAVLKQKSAFKFFFVGAKAFDFHGAIWTAQSASVREMAQTIVDDELKIAAENDSNSMTTLWNRKQQAVGRKVVAAINAGSHVRAGAVLREYAKIRPRTALDGEKKWNKLMSLSLRKANGETRRQLKQLLKDLGA